MGLPDIPNKGTYGHRSYYMRVFNLTSANFDESILACNEGIHLIFTSSTGKKSALMFLGEEFRMETASQQNVLRAWRNVFATYWETYAEMERLKSDNDGIRTLLKSQIPSAYVVTSKDGKSKMVSIKNTVWSSIGMKPTAATLKKFMGVNDRGKKRMVFSAALAAFEALKFKVNFERYEAEEKSEDEKKDEKAA